MNLILRKLIKLKNTNLIFYGIWKSQQFESNVSKFKLKKIKIIIESTFLQIEKIQFLKTGKKNSKHECDLLQAENLKIHEFKFFRLIKIEKKKGIWWSKNMNAIFCELNRVETIFNLFLFASKRKLNKHAFNCLRAQKVK